MKEGRVREIVTFLVNDFLKHQAILLGNAEEHRKKKVVSYSLCHLLEGWMILREGGKRHVQHCLFKSGREQLPACLVFFIYFYREVFGIPIRRFQPIQNLPKGLPKANNLMKDLIFAKKMTELGAHCRPVKIWL